MRSLRSLERRRRRRLGGPRWHARTHRKSRASGSAAEETVMNRRALIFGLSISTSAIAIAAERDAAACGGCFHPPTQVVSDITDERMLLAVSTLQSTLYDQLEYSGSPANFAWVLPIHGTVDIGLSADVLFDSMDVLTETQIVPPVPNCPS